jgi:hypothetical protein
MVEELYKRIVLNPLADEIRNMILEKIKSRLPLRERKGFLFFYKRLLVVFFALVFFWSILVSSLPVKVYPDFPISLSVLAALLLGLVDVILSGFLYTRKMRLSIFLSLLLFVLSVYTYTPLFRFLYLQISVFLPQTLLLLSLVAIPFVLGKSFHSISGKPKMSRKRSFTYCFATGFLLEISCLSRFIWVGFSLVISLALPLFLEFKVYDSVLPASEMELALKKKAVISLEEDRAYGGYHYSILSIFPFFLVRAFGEKTLLIKFKAASFPLEEQLQMLLFSEKEIRTEYNVFLTRFDKESIETYDEVFVSIKNLSPKIHSERFGVTLPVTAKNIRFRDYFDEISHVVEAKFEENQTLSVKYREPLYRNQLAVLKCSFTDRFPKRRPTDGKKSEKSVAREILLKTGNLTAYPLKHLRYRVVSQCEIEFLEALPTPGEFEKKQLVWSFIDLKPNEGKDIRIKFKVRNRNGKEV